MMPDAAISQNAPLSEILDRIERNVDGDRVSLGSLFQHFGRKTFGPFLLLAALIAILPIIGALPGVSLTMAALALFVSVQMLIGGQTLWLPRRILDFSFRRQHLDGAIHRAKPWAKRIEVAFRPRWRFLMSAPFVWFEGLLATVLAIGMAFGALVPGGIVPPAVPMLILGLGLTTQDGLLIVASFALTLLLFAIGGWVIF